MKNYLSLIVIPFLLIILFSCKENMNGPKMIINPDDEELYNLAYSDIEWPIGFYSEGSLEGSLYYENTISIEPLPNRGNQWFQLCTDNKDTARKWSDMSSVSSAYPRDLVHERETEKFYEFKRVYSANPNDVILSRVHKCSYIDRSMYDLMHPSDVIGVFNKDNFDINEVKEVVEYLWFSYNYNNASSKIHLSIIGNDIQGFKVDLYEIEIVFGDYGVKDKISYIKHTFKVKANNGEITHQKELIKKIDGKQN